MSPLVTAAEGEGFVVLSARTGPLETNTYLILSEGKAAVIDPAGEAQLVASGIEEQGAALKLVLLTHTHADHTGACASLMERFPEALLTVPEREAEWLNHPAYNLSYFVGGIAPPPPPDRVANDGDTFDIGTLKLEAMLLPGHTPGSTAFYWREQGVLFSGDVLFQGSIGRVDLPGGDEKAMLDSLKTVVSLPEATLVLPGHGPFTNIAAELSTNPYILPLTTGT